MDLQNAKILITGSSGRVARQVIYELDKIGIKPIAHLRKTSNSKFVDSLNLEKRFADLRNREEIAELVKGIDYIIHTVAKINFHQDRSTQITGINTIAAIDLFQAAKDAGVKKFVHVSSTVAVGGVLRNRITEHLKGDVNLADESHEFNLGHLRIPYIQTKHAAETELKKLSNGTGTELVIVNPSIIMAPSRNKDDQESASKRLPRFVVPDIRNRVNLVDLRDVAKGIILALKKGKNGERYILGGDNLTVRELVLAVSAEIGRMPHLFKYPGWFYRLAANLSLIFSRLTGRSRISFYPDLVKLLDYDWAFSSMKARNDLGYTYRSVYITLSDLLNNEFNDTFLKPTR